ncbi:MAG: hypothetical protein COX77_00775 [Candidatus Komeilibacteria bacterium CG_4_10_14_0_2_um_filter_37_10]|uniref:SCP domain-containing protein n=1 Tax=Candidatus Komeilibacteria bacterium CG_4_10_14_0_2_um_filter_37_10 TaxID=1974470 RepID=A0A2M7VGC6_9BACT|nr:MAG: hypothetical protein COX77_00775 [Candidatus Komeilibacteria bacterium CG_4_10_14_0_2_um_filter_37_10]PJA94265.1 MAG: hypothetical protein CO133_00190 [Candidatus Komeilibacteria bacterium CG_4_9_14_3_um_filter_37_5]
MKQLTRANLIAFFAIFSVSCFSLLFLISPLYSKSTDLLDQQPEPLAIAALTNKVREVKELPPLTWNDKLAQAARHKAQDLNNNNYFSHTSPAGRQFTRWIDEVDYDYQIIGENLAADYQTNRDMMKAWMDSATHRENILNAKYREIGVAVIMGNLNGREQLIIVQIFGTPKKLIISESFSGYNNFPYHNTTATV